MKRVSNREATALSRQSIPFTNSTGSLRGRTMSVGMAMQLGMLPDTWRVEWRAGIAANVIRYGVWSYDTPIAWLLASGEWVKPDVKYSRTTSKHQGLIY